MKERVLQFFPKEVIAQPVETKLDEDVPRDELFSFASHRFEAFNGVKQTDSNFELLTISTGKLWIYNKRDSRR